MRAEEHKSEASIAAAAMYVLEVTKVNASWATWSDSDTAFVRSLPACQRSILANTKLH